MNFNIYIDEIKKIKPTSKMIYLITLWSIVFFLLAFKLENVPPMWFDEGWILSVARNFVELGHYGRLFNGVPINESILNVGPSVIIPIAGSFSVFGIGLLQGRIIIVLFTIGSFVVLYYLTSTLFNQLVAIVAIYSLVLIPTNIETHPLYIGRQVLGELPAIFFVLTGFLLYIFAVRVSYLGIILSICFWGLAIFAKLQILPFLTLGIFITFVTLILKKERRNTRFLGIGLLGIAIIGYFSPLLHNTYNEQSLDNIVKSIVLVSNINVHIESLKELLISSLPFIVAIIYTIRKFITKTGYDKNAVEVYVVKLCILIFVASWFGWYLILSVGWPRYLVIPMFLGSIFFASMVVDLVNESKKHLSMKRENIDKKTILSMFVIIIVVVGFISGMIALIINFSAQFVFHSDNSVTEVAEYINTHTKPDAIIETYDMELFVYLDRNYTYPSDRYQIELITNIFLGDNNLINYDPLSVDPDYLILGPISKFLGIYEHLIHTEQFTLLRDFKLYKIYIRNREFG